MSIAFSVSVKGDFNYYPSVGGRLDDKPMGEVGYIEFNFSNPPPRQPKSIRAFLAGFNPPSFTAPTPLPLKVCYPLPDSQVKVVDGMSVRLDPVIFKTVTVAGAIFSPGPPYTFVCRGGMVERKPTYTQDKVSVDFDRTRVPQAAESGARYCCRVTATQSNQFRAEMICEEEGSTATTVPARPSDVKSLEIERLKGREGELLEQLRQQGLLLNKDTVRLARAICDLPAIQRIKQEMAERKTQIVALQRELDSIQQSLKNP